MISFIREAFASLRPGKYKKVEIKNIGFDSWVYRDIDGYGVAIPYGDEDIYERFSSVILKSQLMKLEGEVNKVLTLTCNIEILRNEFAVIAAQFIEPGIDNFNRNEILRSPLDWWSKWSTLIGNTFVEKKVYDIIGELLSFEYLFESNQCPLWRGPTGGSQDIVTDNGSIEVKSTVRKYGAVITVSSQFQLSIGSKNNRLFFIRLERCLTGDSVESIYERLVLKGVDQEMLDNNLNKAGIHKGSSMWKEKYEILEKRIYRIDEAFPTITANSFKGDKVPTGILKITYDIDLDLMPYEIW